MTDNILSSVDLKSHIAKITLHGVRDRQGVAAQIFSSLGQQGVNAEAITTIQRPGKKADISFAVMEQDLARIKRPLRALKERLGARSVTVDTERALMILRGSKRFGESGATGQIFARFAENGINIEMISSSLSVLTLVIPRAHARALADILKKEFIASTGK